MEQLPDNSDSERRLLGQTELGGLYHSFAEWLVRRAAFRTAPGVYTAPEQPDALIFTHRLEPSVVKAVFFPNDHLVVVDDLGNYFNYMSPHADDPQFTDELESNVYIAISGHLAGSDVTFSIGYHIIREEQAQQPYLGKVSYEYARDRKVIDDEVVETSFGLVGVATYDTDMTLDDGERLRRLLEAVTS